MPLEFGKNSKNPLKNEDFLNGLTTISYRL